MGVKKKALIIGCGNIGALYDFKKEGIKTHTKAFVQHGKFETVVFDKDESLAVTIANHYGISHINNLNNVDLFDVVIISTPTSTHFEYLEQLLAKNIPVIVCEKPITDSIKKLEQLTRIRQQSTSKVLINYFRRFHPCYTTLKKLIGQTDEKLTNIQVVYQRGFSNNASHALDLLYFLFGEKDLTNINISHFAFDEFKNDPTITLDASFGSIPVVFHGLQHVKYSFFELKFFFETKLISVEKNGQSLRLYSAPPKNELTYYPPLEALPFGLEHVNAIENSMMYIAETAFQWLQDSSVKDNFESSVKINFETLKIIESICHN